MTDRPDPHPADDSTETDGTPGFALDLTGGGGPVRGSADPAEVIRDLQGRLRTTRAVAVVLAVVAIFLGVVVFAQRTTGPQQPAAAPVSATVTVTQPAPMPQENQAQAQQTAPQAPATAPQEAVDMVVRGAADDPLAWGDPDAPVVMVEWADFRCPFCAVFATEVLPHLQTEYIDTGLVRFEFNDVAFFGEESFNAAVAARAAGEQGRFVEFMTVLYADAPGSGHPDMPQDKLIGFAEQAGVPDIAQFTTDLSDPDLHAAVQASHDQAQSLGITSVPFFVIGNQIVSGAQPLPQFTAAIDAALAAAG